MFGSDTLQPRDLSDKAGEIEGLSISHFFSETPSQQLLNINMLSCNTGEQYEGSERQLFN